MNCCMYIIIDSSDFFRGMLLCEILGYSSFDFGSMKSIQKIDVALLNVVYHFNLTGRNGG